MINRDIAKSLNQAAMRAGTTNLAQQVIPPPGQTNQLFSPLMQRYMQQFAQGGNAMDYLPRQPNVFEGGSFVPMNPTLPYPIDPAMRSGRPMPRTSQYPVGYNLPTQPGITKLVPFQVLRSLADMYDVARLCIDRRKDMISGLGWDIVPLEDALQGKGKSDRINPKDSQKAAKPDTKVDKDQIKTARQFITDVASKSQRSGEAYKIRFKDGKEQTIKIESCEPCPPLRSGYCPAEHRSAAR